MAQAGENDEPGGDPLILPQLSRSPKRLLTKSSGRLVVFFKLPYHTKKPANLFAPKFQRKRLRIKRLAGFFAFIRSNLCTRHIQKKLTPRGHRDWPDKRLNRKVA
jgi:hypothetical protein